MDILYNDVSLQIDEVSSGAWTLVLTGHFARVDSVLMEATLLSEDLLSHNMLKLMDRLGFVYVRFLCFVVMWGHRASLN